LQRFLDASASERLGPLWRFIASTGCRRGETLGLMWDDVDLDAGTATITRQRAIAGGTVVESAPKTKAGARAVALDAGTVVARRAWRATQNSERLAMGVGWPAANVVFTHPDGTGLWPQMVTARFRRLAGDLGLPAIGVHGLRHSAATWMIAAGVNPRVVQQRLGHAHVAVTLALYTHVLPGHDREAADALGRALDGSP
jgi:integrase